MSTGMSEQKLIVLEMVKNWLEEEDYYVLAAEQVVVRWGSLDGDIANLAWCKTPLKEVVNVLKGTVIPMALMPRLDINVLMGAAQETERMYERGVTVYGECLPQYLNYASKECLTAEQKIITEVLLLCKASGKNTQAISAYNVMDKACDLARIQVPAAVRRNKIIDDLRKVVHVKHRRRGTRLCITVSLPKAEKQEQVKYTCIQIPTLRTEPVTLSPETEDAWAVIAMDKALRK